MFSRRDVLTASGALLLGACRAPTRQHYFEWLSFATTIKVTLETHDRAIANAAAAALHSTFDTINKDWYAWGDGELGKLNAALTQHGSATVSASMANLLRRADELASLTDQHFSPAVGPLVKLWGFDKFDAGVAPRALPSAQAINVSRELVASGYRLDTTSAETKVIAKVGSLIDLGGIAKGAALAVGLETLQSFALDGALIDAGGDVATLATPQRAPYRIGVRLPTDRGPVVKALQVMPGESVMTSGDYARYWEIDGQRYQHIIDSRTGMPASGIRWATVISQDPLLADAAATALVVASRDDFYPLCDVMQVSDAMIAATLTDSLMTDSMRLRVAD